MEATVRLPTKSVCAPIPLFADTLLILEKLDIFINVLAPFFTTLILTLISAYRVAKKKIYKRRLGVSGYNSETSIKHECHLLYFTLMTIIAVFVVPSAAMKAYYVLRSMFTVDTPLTMREHLLLRIMTLLSSVKACTHVFYFTACSQSFRSCVAACVQRVCALLCGWCTCVRSSTRTSISIKDEPEELVGMLEDLTGKTNDTSNSRKALIVTANSEMSKFQAREAAV